MSCTKVKRRKGWRMSCDVGDILQPFRHFTYVTAHSPTLPSLYLRQSSFSKPSVAWPTSQFVLQPFFRFSYVTSSSLNSPGESPMILNSNYSLSSFSKLSVTSPTSQLILQPFRRVTYVTAHSPTLLSLLLRHRLFTYVTWRAAHGTDEDNNRAERHPHHKYSRARNNIKLNVKQKNG